MLEMQCAAWQLQLIILCCILRVTKRIHPKSCHHKKNFETIVRIFHNTCKYQVIMLYIWNKYNVICQLYLNKKEKRRQQFFLILTCKGGAPFENLCSSPPSPFLISLNISFKYIQYILKCITCKLDSTVNKPLFTVLTSSLGNIPQY